MCVNLTRPGLALHRSPGAGKDARTEPELLSRRPRFRSAPGARPEHRPGPAPRDPESRR